MKKILLTGSLGFIAGNFVRKFIYEKIPYTIVSVDKVVRKNHINSVYTNRAHQFYMGDITDSHFMDCVFELERPDVVIHMAASTFVDDSIKDPHMFLTNNVLGTQVVVDKCIKFGVEKLIHLSTDEVYGHLTSETEPGWREDQVLNPRNPYSASKASSEMIVRAAAATYGLNFNIVRPSNNYGPRQTTEKLIPKIIKCVVEKKPIPIYGNGSQIRDWTHVFDNCSAIYHILENGGKNETYNVSAHQEFSNLEVVNMVCNVLREGHDLITFVPEDTRPGHDFRYSVDTSKVKQLGWSPTIKFRDGINQVCDWYMKNKWFLAL